MDSDTNPEDAPSPAKPATIYDVARLAGVSHATVTRMIKGFEGIRPETRARVEKALETLDYRPNMAARSLITGRSHRIGALTHEIDQVGPSRILQGAAAAARRTGHVLDIVTLDMADPGAIREGLELVAQPGLAGVVILSSTDEMRSAFERTAFRVPVLFSSEREGVISGPEAPLDSAMDQIVEHLVSLGHRSFFHIAGARNWTSARNRELAYQFALESHGLTSVGSAYGDWSSRSGYEIARQLPGDVTALVCSNDQMALGAMLALNERGISIPGDVSVTGLDDIPEAAYFSPPLTTIRLAFAAQGAEVVSRLLTQLDIDHVPSDPVPPPELIVRQSTGAAG